MARVTKEYDERLTEFLNTAQQLFFEKGYEQTSISHIIDKMGVAKGTFYHYFKTKGELLDKLALRYSQEMLGKLEEVVKRTDMNAVEKLNQFFILGRSFKLDNIELMKVFLKALYNDDNLRLRHKIFQTTVQLVNPIFIEIIRQGMEEGVFDVDYPDEVAKLIFSIAKDLNESISMLLLKLNESPENMDVISRKLKAYERTLEKIFGLPPDTIRVAEREHMLAFKLDKEEKGK